MKNLFFTFIFLIFSSLLSNAIEEKAVPSSVDFDLIKENQTLKSPFKVKMKVFGLKVRPAGEDTKDSTSGHHHILINSGPIAKGEVIPADDKHIHYGKGQTEAEIKLPKGEYTLTLQFANGAHQSYGPELSKSIKIKVIE